MADDDPEDCQLVQEALAETGLGHNLRAVSNGEELLDYLHRRNHHAQNSPRPDLVLLDLNMPKKDGREVLRDLKSQPDFQSIPVVVLTTSTADDDIRFCYRSGASAYFKKPASFHGLCELMRTLSTYWFEHAHLPPRD
jgi:CheY-like chemotaxis protein